MIVTFISIYPNNFCLILSIVLGHRYEHSDPVFQSFVHNMQAVLGNISTTSLANTLPILYFTPFYKNFRIPSNKVIYFIKDHINEHRRESETVTEIRDVIDFLAVEMARRRQRGPAYDDIKIDREWRLITDLFAAGISTTTDTLNWALLLLTKNPGILKEVGHIDNLICFWYLQNMSTVACQS